jgi:[acyl-carrier-protein] S-malonyltransferase
MRALLFPGQGSQVPGMREIVAAHRPDLLELAVEQVGADPFELLDEGTRFAQPALYCASIALWDAAGSPGAEAVAGHSLGEIAALVAAGALGIEDGLRLAVCRGRLMQRAADDAAPGGMVALLGNDLLASALAERYGLVVANENAPGQVVVSGPDDGLQAAVTDAKPLGLKAMRLAIRGAFHSPAMASVLPHWRAALAETEIRPPGTPVYSGVTARPFDDVRRRLAEALVKPVRWRETLLSLQDAGVRHFCEVGPGKVLNGLVRRTLPEVDVRALADLEPASA